MDSLIFKYVTREGKTNTDNISRKERRYLYFVVSGQSLGELLGLPGEDLIGVFAFLSISNFSIIRKLRGGLSFPDGVIPFYLKRFKTIK